jgi:hypothetical protein
MKATLEFDLDEPEEYRKFGEVLQARYMTQVLWEMAYNVRKPIERQIETDIDAGQEVSGHEAVDRVFEKFFALMNQYHIDID